MPYKVIVQGTGFVGKMVIRELVAHPDFEIVGCIVNDPAKHGRDAGEIAGIGPIGVIATTDIDAALAVPADALAHFGPTAALAAQNIDHMSRALRAGKNVVSTAMTPFVYPKSCPPSMLEPLEKACREGDTSCFTTGIDPGFANDLFPMTLMGVCGRVDRVRIQEILDYSTYTGDYSTMGFGEPLEQKAILENPQVLIFAWGHTIPMIADAIGAPLEKIDTVYEKWEAPERIVVPARRDRGGHLRRGALRDPRLGRRRAAHRRGAHQPHHDGGGAALAAPEDRGQRRLSHRDRGQPEHRAGDRVPRRGRRRERGRLPGHGHARGERDPGGMRGEARPALAARSAADPGPWQHASLGGRSEAR